MHDPGCSSPTANNCLRSASLGTRVRQRVADCGVVQVCSGATEAGYTLESNEGRATDQSREGVTSEKATGSGRDNDEGASAGR
jgi:hypothetical protein